MTMRSVFVLLFVGLSVALAVPSVLAQRGPTARWEDGIVIAADLEVGFLVLECHDEYRYVVVDFRAPIHDFRGRAVPLRDVRGGDFVEYRLERPDGYPLATELRVTPNVNPTRLGAHW
jgi:hypothetical protein